MMAAAITEAWPHVAEDGRLYRVERYHAMTHGIEESGVVWDAPPDCSSGVPDVRVYMPESGTTEGPAREFSAEELRQLPEFLKSEPEGPAVADHLEPPPEPGERGLKYRYEKALRGRVGNGPGQLTPAEFVVLVMLLTYADENLCNARPGGTRLAADCGLTGSTAARRATERAGEVAAKGYAAITRRGTNTGGNSAQTYRLKLPEWP